MMVISITCNAVFLSFWGTFCLGELHATLCRCRSSSPRSCIGSYACIAMVMQCDSLLNYDSILFCGGQANSLIDVPQLPKGLVSLVQEEHDEWLHIEAAWLLAHLCSGPEMHMHTMVKHGAAGAVVRRLCSALSKVYSPSTQYI